MDNLRSEIWDYLFRESDPKTVDDIAKHVGSDVNSVRQAVAHEWFEAKMDRISIAYRGKSSVEEQRW